MAKILYQAVVAEENKAQIVLLVVEEAPLFGAEAVVVLIGLIQT